MMGIPMYAGFTGYYYSDNFDSDYEEINIGADIGFMSIDAAVDGEYELATEPIKVISITQLLFLYLLLD